MGPSGRAVDELDGGDASRHRELRVEGHMELHASTDHTLDDVTVDDEEAPPREVERSLVPGSRRVAVISHRLWTTHFDNDSEIIGRTIAL